MEGRPKKYCMWRFCTNDVSSACLLLAKAQHMISGSREAERQNVIASLGNRRSGFGDYLGIICQKQHLES